LFKDLKEGCKFDKNQIQDFMITNNVVIAHPKDVSDINALKAFMKALHIKFEIEEPYNKAFVTKMKNSKKQYGKGNFITVEKNKINEFLGL
jgi:hypothetical protein